MAFVAELPTPVVGLCCPCSCRNPDRDRLPIPVGFDQSLSRRGLREDEKRWRTGFPAHAKTGDPKWPNLRPGRNENVQAAALRSMVARYNSPIRGRYIDARPQTDSRKLCDARHIHLGQQKSGFTCSAVVSAPACQLRTCRGAEVYPVDQVRSICSSKVGMALRPVNQDCSYGFQHEGNPRILVDQLEARIFRSCAAKACARSATRVARLGRRASSWARTVRPGRRWPSRCCFRAASRAWKIDLGE
jgi:hypothetical protein